MIDIYISPCPNDTFMFHSLCTGRRQISQPLNFHFLDIAELNQRVSAAQRGVFKLSFATLFEVEHNYLMLQSGAALGYGCGPLLISKPGLENPCKSDQVAIPGKSTTAFALLRHYFPEVSNFVPMRFDEIPARLLSGEIDYGLVIHETRFVYESLGLSLIADLGQLFESETGAPIPLGAIAVHRSIESSAAELEQAIRNSILDSNQQFPMEFCAKYAQEMDADVLREHVKTYVNHFSLDLDEAAQSGISKLRAICKQI